jgi:hypothetical protein
VTVCPADSILLGLLAEAAAKRLAKQGHDGRLFNGM